MNSEINRYIQSQAEEYKNICDLLAKNIDRELPKASSKIWHAHPVWFLDGNPTVGFSIQKPGVRLMFWSGADFDEPDLKPGTGKFKDASIYYTSIDQVSVSDVHRWLEKSQQIQWDYQNLIKNKGLLEKRI